MANWKDLTKTLEARALVPKLSTTCKRTLKYLLGDYWQGGDCWAGTPIPADAVNRAAIEQEIQNTLVPQPIVEEVIGRHVHAVVGQEPSFEALSSRSTEHDQLILDAFESIKAVMQERARNAAPGELSEASAQLDIEDHLRDMAGALGVAVEDDEVPGVESLPAPWQQAIQKAKVLKAQVAQESASLAEINAALGTWWDTRKGHETIQEFTAQLKATGRASMRFFIPAGLVEPGVDGAFEVKVKDWKEALDRIYLEVPEPESAAIATDRDTMKPISIFCYKHKKENGDVVDRVEVSFVDKNDQTIVRILEDDVIVEGGEAIHDTGGELYVDEAVMPPLITEPVQRTQNALNVLNTMILHNGNLAGFRERNYINLQRPKKRVLAPTEDNPNATALVDDDVQVGPAAANFLTGIKYKDQHGNEQIASGSIVVGQPVSPEPLIEGAERFEESIYKATSQLHVKITGDATASAVSRVQARADFVESLQQTRPKVEGVLRSRLRGVLVLAAYLAGDTKKVEEFKQLRVRVDCRINAGPLAPDERRVLLEEYEKGTRSLESTMVMLGTEDILAELQKLRGEQAQDVERRTTQIEWFSLFAQTFDVLDAAELAELPTELLEKIRQIVRRDGTEQTAEQQTSEQQAQLAAA